MDNLNLPIDTNKKKNQIEMPSIRFELRLEKPSSDKFSEFNFNKLCLKTFKTMKKLNKKNKTEQQDVCEGPKMTTINSNDLNIIDGEFQIEKKRVAELLATFRNKVILSKEMDREEGGESNELVDDEYTNESEFSVKNSKKSKKKASKGFNGLDLNKFRYADFSHLGKGYDESDSFIDNSDAKDVHIPKNLVPKRGGFYINRERLKLATIDEVKKSKKSKKEADSDQSGDDSDQESEEFSETEDSDFEDSEDESEDSEDDDEEEADDESSDDDEDEESEKTDKITKTIPEIDLASSNSESCKASLVQNIKKPKKIINDDDEHEEKKEEMIQDENNEMTKNKENKLILPVIDPMSINSKKRKNDSQTNDISLNMDKVQAKITNSTGDLEDIEANIFKKKKLEPIQDLPKPTLNTQILNEKNRLLNQSNTDNKPIKCHDDSNDYIDVEEDHMNQTNKSLLTDTSMTNNNGLNRSNLNQSLTNQNPHLLPENIPNDFKNMINKFTDMYTLKINTISEPLTLELRTILSNIYTESKRLKYQSQIFNYLAFKTGRNKDNLFRICRRILNKEISSSQPVNTLSTSISDKIITPTQISTKPHNFATPTLPSTPQTPKVEIENLTKIKQSPPVSPQFSDLGEELKTKLLNLKKEYLTYKQRQEVAKFLETPQIHNLIYAVDVFSRNSNNSRNPVRLRDFCISYLAESFELNKDVFLRKYNTICSQIRMRNLENNLKNKMNELKKEIDAEMPRNLEKYSRLLDEFNKNKFNEPNEELRKKMNPPRKKFELTEKIRELILSIIQIKMGLFRSSLTSPSPQNSVQNDASIKLNYIDNFFESELIFLWPKNWMQKNVLLNFYQIKYCQQIQQQRTSQNSQVKSTNTPVTTTPITINKQPNPVINISSKNGKSVKIEPQTSGQINQNFVQSPQIVLNRINSSSTPKSAIQNSQLSQLNQSKSNVYDTVVSQHKKKPVNTNTNVNTSLNTSHKVEDLYPSQTQKTNKSPHNLFQISSLINNATNSSDLNKLQQQLNFMLPNLVQGSNSLPNLTQAFSNSNTK
ncbi:unnamed protein product [Brachionus calyciflorus]|uniref:Uncharacterized protein n=1 Tax=Brachionus calyciflorus TaxID=104777 RepID=A0A813RE64_9BILA|nr:unnamed protein product [Brachionus calyciflorus]